MIKNPSPRHKARMICTSLLLFGVWLQLSSMNAIGQTTVTRLTKLAVERAAKKGSNLRAAFSCTPRYPSAGQAIQFQDASTGSPISWNWNFGDGATSAARNPIHTYTTAGFRKVTLTVANDLGSKITRRTITVLPEAAATFVYSPSTPGPGQTVQFADTTSGDPTAWQWDFGDGTRGTIKNPSHAYMRTGSYTVTLIASNGSSSKHGSQTLSVASISVLSSSFTFAPAVPSVGQTVQFTDTSTGTPASWQWNFGDGATSTAQNPSHAFAAAGSRTVTLTVTNSSGSNTATRTVTVAAGIEASFSYSPVSPAIGQTVQFTDASTGTPTSWQWNFGDGTTSTAQNPSHAFAAAGSRIVTLTVTNSSGSSTTTRTVPVVAELTAAFSYSPTSPTAGQAVQFTDTSTGTPTLWQWNFGDGATSVLQNPSHPFTSAGSYNITLTVMTASGQDTASQTITVAQASMPIASFTVSPASPAVGQAVRFTDTSTGSPVSWQWDFGDGLTSTTQNPSHTFSAAASYNVILSAANSSGSDSHNQAVSVSSSSSDIHYAASSLAADIQAAIDAASDGDTVRVPAGEATWTSNVTIPATKGVRLIGAGMGSTNINLNNAQCLYFYPRQANQPVRVSGFSFTNCPAPSLQINDYSVGSNNWRVDHCSWTNGALGTQLNVHGHTFGVIDNCTFTNTLRTIWVDGQVRPFDTTGSPMPYPGGYSWQQPITMGGPDAVYIEDCTFHNTTASIFHNMRGGARFVFRHNTVTGINGLETHSGCTPGYRNPRWIEIYENTFDLQGLGTYWCGLFLRSTNGIVFNNRFSAGYPTVIRFDNETSCLDSCASPWASANKTAYPAQDQIGAGRDTGWGTPQATDEAKLWIWGNTQGGNPVSPQFTSCANSADLVQLGRDYFLSAPPSYTPYTYPHPLRND